MYKDALNKGFLIRICYIELMIIICPSCKKKFELEEDLIPDKGRLLKCGSCDEIWFYNKKEQSNLDQVKETSDKSSDDNKGIKDELLKSLIEKNKLENHNLPKNKGVELVKYKPKSSFTIIKTFNYLIVLIITFVAVIITLDTFKDPLSAFFPNLELILYNLFESLRDIVLFAKDLK